MKLSSFRYLVRQGFDNVWKNRVMAFASFCVLLVSLLLVGISVLFYININAIIGGIEDKNEAVIFLLDDTPDARIAEIGETLKQMDNVSSVTLYTGEEALENLKSICRIIQRSLIPTRMNRSCRMHTASALPIFPKWTKRSKLSDRCRMLIPSAPRTLLLSF